MIDKNGWSPLHAACADLRSGVASVHVVSTSNINASDHDGYHAIHLAMLRVWSRGYSLEAQKTLQLLIQYGAEWDSTCDQIADQVRSWPSWLGEKPRHRINERWSREAPAIRICIKRWTQEQRQGLPFTKIPYEQVCNGADATHMYIRELAASRDVRIRRKISVVGPSNWGKTSLITSLTTQLPTLMLPDDRTIGIDHFNFAFDEQLDELKVTKKHEVTFWDFAGQDAYQVAHSLFYSARTLYLVCIDLESYALALMQAELMTDTESEADRWMNEFVDTKILRWIRVICARQPDAEFLFVATKSDRLPNTDIEGDDGVIRDLQQRLANVEVIIQEMKMELDEESQVAQEASMMPGRIARLPITHLGDPRLARIVNKRSVRILVTSCVTSGAIDGFTTEIQDVIKQSDRGFPMPDKFSLVLNALLQLRAKALASPTDKRIARTFRAVEELIHEVITTVTKPVIDEVQEGSSAGSEREADGEPYLDEVTCRTIMQTLRDLGDVLWYETIADELLKNTIILDPMLMIDFVRDIFDHNHTSEVMAHHTLKGLAHWRHLGGTEVILSMKRVLQHFDLVYPTAGEMSATSDLIVPAYWKTNTSAFWMFGGGDLRFGKGVHREDVAIRVHFEYQFVNNYPDTLFDHVVVASYSPFYKRDVGPDWIMYKEDDKLACRLMVGRDHQTHHPMLHLEALQGHSASEGHAGDLWDIFSMISESLEKVVRGYPGVVVCRFVREDTDEDIQQTRYTLETLQHFKPTRLSRKWLPPPQTWEAYLEFYQK